MNFCLETKCAEIHYYTSNFTIICEFCQEVSGSFLDFVHHFQRKHLDSNEWPERKQHVVEEETVAAVKKEHPEINDERKDQWMIDALVEENDDDDNEPEYYFGYEDQTSKNVTSSLEGTNNMDLHNTEGEDVQSEIDWSETYTPLLNKSQKRPYKPRNQPNRCSYCGKTFRRRYQLDTHLNIHTGLKPHQCDICGRQFRAINTLQRHLNTHGIRKTYTCKYCFKEFNHRAAYVSHETRHIQKRQVPCDDCDKFFYTHNQLDTHKRKMHKKLDANDLPYACDICSKKYRSASMLSTHKFKKHFKMAKYICQLCDKKFVEEYQLKTHMGIHVIKDGTDT